jgi:hypothetical protein
MRRIGILLPAAADDAEFQARVGAFLQALALLGWTIGRNVRIDTRWAGANADDTRKYAAELAALTPDAILVYGARAVGARSSKAAIHSSFILPGRPMLYDLLELDGNGCRRPARSGPLAPGRARTPRGFLRLAEEIAKAEFGSRGWRLGQSQNQKRGSPIGRFASDKRRSWK